MENSTTSFANRSHRSSTLARMNIPGVDKVRHSITIESPVMRVYAFWRDFTNLTKIFKDVRSITNNHDGSTHWVIRLKNGTEAEWDADLVSDIPNQLISWKSREGSRVTTAGMVTFEEALNPGQTIVRLLMDYSVPGGKLTEWATFFSGEDPDTLTVTNLKRLKAVLETGEYPTVEGQPSGRKEH